MGNIFMRTNRPITPPKNAEDLNARELGLENNLKLTEVNTLIDYYKRKDPNNDGLLPDEFKEAAGEFMASELTIDPTIIFNIFDTGEGGVAGRVTLREFILGYAILCKGSTEGRLKYLFAIYDDIEGTGYLTRSQLISCLRLMQRIVFEVSNQDEDITDDEKEEQINSVADQLLADSDPESKKISYTDFIEKLREDDLVTTWLENLTSVAGEHLKYMERRELDLVELNMEREGLLPSATLERNIKYPQMQWQSSKHRSITRARGSSPIDRKLSIPMPKKQKVVRRDMRRQNSGDENTTNQEEGGFQEINAAKPFVINYDQIVFGKILGRGGCATVYEGEWMHVPVAIKVFYDVNGEAAGVDKLASNLEETRKAIVGDYVEEFWLLLQIRHPNCLLYMGICFEPVVCIVTELYTGGSVTNFLNGPNPRKFTPEKALEMMCGVARGMFYLHASSPPILHRDLKANNILINRTLTHCVICDFGLSRQFVNEASGLASREGKGPGGGVGTPYTMAPEVIQHSAYTPAADVYSFGIVMYEMYTGRFPFPKMKPMQLLFFVTEGNRPKFFEEDKVPITLRKLIEKCWAQKPEDRPTFEEILTVMTSKELEGAVADLQPSAATAIGGDRTINGSLAEDELSRRLLEAAYRGRDEIVARLIDRGAKVNYSDYDKRTALHVAAAEGRTRCIRMLISAGARLSFDRWSNSPIADAANYASRTGDTEPIRLLRAIEGRSNGPTSDTSTINVVDSHQRVALRNQAAMIAAADGDIATIKRLIQKGLDVNSHDYDRRTPLSIAASEGRREIAELLIRQGADVYHRDRWASTAYHEAARGGYHDIMRLIRQAGVDDTKDRQI